MDPHHMCVYLCEMFDELPIEIIWRVVAETQRNAGTLDTAVDKCLKEMEVFEASKSPSAPVDVSRMYPSPSAPDDASDGTDESSASGAEGKTDENDPQTVTEDQLNGILESQISLVPMSVTIDLTSDSDDEAERGSPGGGGDGDVAPAAYDEFDEEMRRAIEMSLKMDNGNDNGSDVEMAVPWPPPAANHADRRSSSSADGSAKRGSHSDTSSKRENRNDTSSARGNHSDTSSTRGNRGDTSSSKRSSTSSTSSSPRPSPSSSSTKDQAALEAHHLLPLEAFPEHLLSASAPSPSSSSQASKPSADSAPSTYTVPADVLPFLESPPPERDPKLDRQTSEAQRLLEARLQTICRQNSLVSARDCVATLAQILGNILKSPQYGKYRRVRLDNAAFQRKVGRLHGGTDFLVLCGFRRDDVARTLELGHHDLARIYIAKSLLEDQLVDIKQQIFARGSDAQPGGGGESKKKQNGDINTRRNKKPRLSNRGVAALPKPKPKPRISREEMARLAEQRLAKASSAAPSSSSSSAAAHLPPRVPSPADERKSVPSPSSSSGGDKYKLPPLSSSDGSQARPGAVGPNAALYNQIRKIRSDKHRKWRNTALSRKRQFTLDDIHKMRMDEINNPMGSEKNYIGRAALRMTNEFRKKHGLPPLSWSEPLARIGKEHSKDMADGKVPFSHTGFKKRCSQYPFPYRSAAENLAMSNGVSEVARCAVDGWIDSPGHRRNLLARHNLCGIGVYRANNGAYYLTQMFALTS